MFSSRPAIGAVVYPPSRPPETLLAEFAGQLAARGFRLGGVLQDTFRDETGRKTEMRLTEVDTGRTMSIGQNLGKESRSCILDSQALAGAVGSLRRGIETHADLLFFNKFSKSEVEGQGLAEEMLAAVAEGVAVLTAVPGVLIEEWTAFTGGQTELIAPSLEALWRWWGPGRLYADLVNGVGEAEVKRVVIGFNWIMVETPTGIGLAQTPERGTPGCRGAGEAGAMESRGLKTLAQGALSSDPLEAALGIAACNAWYNRFDLEASADNGLDSFGRDGNGTVVIGAFPGIAERLPGAKVIDRRPAPGQFPEQAAEWLLPGAEAVIITAAALANRSLPNLLRLAAFSPVALVGPGAPLTERLFSYGISAASGVVVTDADGLARAVAQGAGAKELKRHCRQATLGIQSP